MNITPLGEQIIIRTIPVESIGSIIVPDSAKSITLTGSKETKASHYLIESDVFAGVKDLLQGHTRKDASSIIRGFLQAKNNATQADLVDAVHYVEAEVIACGPGKRQKGDHTLVDDLVRKLDQLAMHDQGAVEGTQALIDRAANRNNRIPPIVQPGDRILYHPAVQKFDREITDLMNGAGESGSRYFIIREESVLAVIDAE